MKSVIKLILVVIFIVTGSVMFSQSTKQWEKLEIQTSAQCDMCKKLIEKSMAYEKGVKTFNLDVKTAILSIGYDPKKTTPDKIRLAISKIGYDADDVLADPKAYERLDACCKKGAHHD